MSAARRALDGFEHMLDLSVFYDASLCVSELVTNAVLHAEMGPEDELALDVTISDTRLSVAVTDPGRGFEPPQPTPGDESGYGLYIVDRLSDRWGVERGEGTRVWFEMALRTESGAREPDAEELPEPRRRPFTARQMVAGPRPGGLGSRFRTAS